MIGFPTPGNVRQPFQQRFPTYAERGMIGAAHPLTVETGLAILRDGGNAIDAIVGAGLTAAVVMPEMCGLGGDLFAVVSHPQTGIWSLQGSGVSPKQADIERMRAASPDGAHMPPDGPLAMGVPGMVDAYVTLLERFGTKRFADVAQYAIHHARNGFIVHHEGADAIAGNAELIKRDPAAAAIFLRDGKPIAEGERLTQSGIADTIEAIAREGRDTFYEGDIARRITDYVQSRGGALSLDDLAGHRSDVGQPIRTTYRGTTVYQTALPSQGVILLEALNLAEQASVEALWDADAIHLLTEIKKIAFADRLGHTADPAFHTPRLEVLLSKEWAASRFQAIDMTRSANDVSHGALQDGDTTYISAIDDSGVMVSMIQSVSSAFGCGVVGGDTGVVLNNRVGRGFSLVEGHPNIYAPGKKTMHTLNAFLIADERGRPVLVGGTPGGDGQPQWNLQAIVGLVDGELDVQAAIDLPRFTSWPGTDPASVEQPFELRIESRVGGAIVADLEARGHRVVTQAPWAGGGAMQLIARDPQTGVLIGGSDPRVEGTVLGF